MPANTPKVTIGMPIYNGARHLAESLDSLLGQTYQNLEILVSDNASTDDTLAICGHYAAADPRIRILRQETNIGAARNWNFVAERANGEYFKWASANDVCKPTLLEACVGVLEQSADVALCYSNTVLFDDEGRQLGLYEDPLDASQAIPSERFKSVWQTLRLNNAQNAGVVRTSVLRKTGLEGIYMGGDIPLMCELSLYGRFERLDEPLFLRRYSENSWSGFFSNTEQEMGFNRPGNSDALSIDGMRLLAGLCGRVIRARIPLSQKLSLFPYLLRIANWRKGIIWNEVKNLRVRGSSN